MNLEILSEFLFWCGIINMGLLLWWVLLFIFAHDWIYHYHSKWFKLSIERFDAIHYAGMVLFKISLFIFNIVPWLALKII